MQVTQCKICANTEGNHTVIAREMMFGLRDEFTYFKCSSCGCLQIVDVPKDLSKYYPTEKYYSYRQIVTPNSSNEKFKNLLKYFLFNAYKHLNLSLQILPYVKNYSWLNPLGKLSKKSAILDVGCGDGLLLQQMSIWGFENLTGIDPFIKENISYLSKIKVWKTDIYNYPPLRTNMKFSNENINTTFDLIMLHHSFEHMDNPRKVLNRLYQLLNPNGTLLIRIPVADSFAWRKYGVNWFQLDAPRHFFLHTTKSITLLAKSCGFILKHVFYDSTEAQFMHSEKYCRDISLFEPMQVSRRMRKDYKKCAKWLNRMMDGDQACFVLKK